MNIPCPSCAPCNAVTPPYVNLSSEAPDKSLLWAYNYGWTIPPIGSDWKTWNCTTPCAVSTSDPEAELEAIQCAANNQLLCVTNPDQDPRHGSPDDPIDESNGGNSSPPPINPTTGQPYQTYPSLAMGCTINCPDGTPFVYQIPAGTVLALSRELANRIAQSICRQRAISNVICLGNLTPTACQGDELFSELYALTQHPPITFALSGGSLPPGTILETTGPVSAAVVGETTAAGSYSFQVQATDALGNTTTKTYTISVFGITNPSLPDATPGTDYNETLSTAGGTAPITFALADSTLPDGLSLDPDTGTISGTPTTAGDYTFDVEITSSD